MIKNLPVNAEDLGLIPGFGKSLGGGNGNSLQYSCLEMAWTEESGGLQSMESQRVLHDLMTKQQHRAKNDKILPLFLCRFLLHSLNLTRFKFKNGD